MPPEEQETDPWVALRTPPSERCDLIMKGGITSGVVYPHAIIQLAQKYRLSCVGGTSAGAIAAGLAAAAEHGRKEGGFEVLDKVARELPGLLTGLFQPIPPLRPIFASALLALNKPLLWRLRIYLRLSFGYFLTSVGGGLLGAAVGAGLGWGLIQLDEWPLGVTSFGLLGALFGQIYFLFRRIGWALTRDLNKARFGLCPGIQQRGFRSPALLEWLSSRLDEAAGLAPSAGPLTFGHLESRGITLEMMTTNLAEGRPYRLPFKEKRFFFDPLEFDEIFPAHINEALKSGKLSKSGKYRQLPVAKDLPVIVAIRMSLSFPVLLQTVPLYAQDFTIRDKKERGKLQRCIFSDGGISSNLPIHFFDSPLPSRPTFAINLEDFDEKRHLDDENNEIRVELPLDAQKKRQPSFREVDGVGKFFGGVLNAMQNWQDNQRLVQPGTRERVVSIRLKKGQGGLNLTMAQGDVDDLIKQGGKAGALLREKFDFDRHRWRRYLVWSGALERSFDNILPKYDIALVDQDDDRLSPGDREDPFQGDLLNYRAFLEQYEPTEYEVGVAQREDTNHRSQVLFETYSRLNREEVSGGNTPEEMDAPLEPGSEKKPKLRRRFSQGPMPKPSPRLNLIPEE